MKRNVIHKQSIFLLLLQLILLTPVSGKKKETLIPDKTIIILPARANDFESKSALVLNTWLKKIYKTENGFEIVKDNVFKDSIGFTILSIGRTRFITKEIINSISTNGFIIKKKENLLTICGNIHIATYVGTGYFLDHFCGVRFYMPGTLFTSQPKLNKVTFEKDFSIKEEPFAKYVLSTGYELTEENDWAQLNGLIRKTWGSHQHSMGERFYNDSIIKKYPEIFPIYNGERYFPKSKVDQSWQPDFAEPKLVDAGVESAIIYFRTHPDMEYISFSVMDSPKYPKEGKVSEYLKKYPNDKEGQISAYSDAFYEFLNNLAIRLEVELPKNGIIKPKTIVFIVYGKIKDIPHNRLHPSLLPVIVANVCGRTSPLIPPRWSSYTNRFGLHDWAEGAGFIIPRIYSGQASKFVKAIHENKMTFEYAHMEAYPNWGLDGPKYFIMSKIYWNPNVNTDSLLTLFCSDMFGKAKTYMKSYFLNIEKLTKSMHDLERERRIGDYASQLILNKDELLIVKEARKQIDKSIKIAETKEEKERIELFSKTFRITEYFFEIYNSTHSEEIKIDELRTFLKDSIAGNYMTLSTANEIDFLEKMDKIINGVIASKHALEKSK